MKTIQAAFFSLFFLSTSVLASPPHFDLWFDYDPANIVVEDPNVVLLAELPSGDYNLKEYRATSRDIETYSKEFKIEKGDLKDNPKVPNCTRAEVDAVRLWQTNDVYPMVNKILRMAQKGKLNGATVEAKYENIILMIASASNCAPEYEGPAIRGENLPDFLLNQYKVGNYLGMRGFTSTSKGDELTYWFEEHSKQRIYFEKVKGADFAAFGVATWPEEHEVLIRPGTVFKVLSKTKATNSKFIQWDFQFSQF